MFLMPIIIAACFLCVLSILNWKLPAFNEWIDDDGHCNRRHHPLGDHPVIKQCFIIAGSLVLIGTIFSTIFYFAGTSHINHNEIWNYKMVDIEHWEKWTTEESRQVSYPCGTDKDGNTTYCTRTEYYTETHGPYWYAIDETGSKHNIDKSEYEKWKNIWDNEKKIGHNKGSSAGFSRSISGDILGCRWTREFETIYPGHSIHSYENRIRGSHSVFRTIQPTKEMIKKWPRPADLSDPTPIFGFGISISEDDILYIQRVNAKIGPAKQIHTIYYAMNSSEYSRGITDEIMSAWDGPNKNELCIFMGINPKNNNIDWIRVESWMDNTTLHSLIEGSYLNKKLNFRDLGQFVMNRSIEHWNRKEFKDFEYLPIKISFWWYFAEVLACFFIGFGVIFFCKYQLSY